MDALNRKILAYLMENSRMPVTILARKIKASREVVDYRIKKLVSDKIILGFITEIDMKKLGYVGAALFLNIKSIKVKEFKKYIAECPFVSWGAELTGVWSYGLSIYGKTTDEVDQNFSILYNRFKDDIINHRFTFHRISTFFYHKYFGGVEKIFISKIKYMVDDVDKFILKELSQNSRIDTVKIARLTKLTAPAIAKRIKKLEQSGYILKYSLFVDLEKINLLQYSIFIDLNNEDNREKIFNFLSQKNNVSFIAQYLGDEFLEFGVIVKDPYVLRETLLDIGEHFPENKILEVFQFYKEYLSIGAPKIAFRH